jgi:hypothetical protein
MNGRIPDRAPRGEAATWNALAIALGAGALALVSPVAAVLMLSVLGARALLRGEALQIDLAKLAGPLFGAVIVGAFAGLPGAIGVLFVWRLHADAAWSIATADRLAAVCGGPVESKRRLRAHAWLTPLYGLTVVAFTSPHLIAGLPLDLPHVPIWVPIAAGCAAAGALFDWLLRRAVDWRLGELAPTPSAHLLAHHLLFLVAFGLTLDVSAGMVAIAAWRLAHAAPLRFAQPSFTAAP